MSRYIAHNQLDDPTFAQITASVEQAQADGIAPAVALSVIHSRQLVFSGTWGWLDPTAEEQPIKPDTYFDLASITKLYTTVSVLRLISEKKLALSMPLVDIVPAFGNISPRSIGGGQNPHTKEIEPVDPIFAGNTVQPDIITIRHLLTHTSGLPPWRDVYRIAPPPPPPTEVDPLSSAERWAKALDTLCQYAFVAPPDTGVRYSDIGLMLLGEVVARCSQTSLADAIATHTDNEAVFHPMKHGLSRNQIAPTEYDSSWRKRRIWGEVHDENACGAGGVAGHAGLFATADSVARFGMRWLHREFDIEPELAAAATELQAKTGAEVRGLGWMLKSDTNSSAGDLFHPTSYGHTGFTGTSLWIDPQRELIVALLTNRVYPGRDKPGIHNLRRTLHDAIVRGVA